LCAAAAWTVNTSKKHLFHYGLVPRWIWLDEDKNGRSSG
jgi:hypothetical protein